MLALNPCSLDYEFFLRPVPFHESQHFCAQGRGVCRLVGWLVRISIESLVRPPVVLRHADQSNQPLARGNRGALAPQTKSLSFPGTSYDPALGSRGMNASGSGLGLWGPYGFSPTPPSPPAGGTLGGMLGDAGGRWGPCIHLCPVPFRCRCALCSQSCVRVLACGTKE